MNPDDVKFSHSKPIFYEQLHEIFGVEWDNGLIVSAYPYIYCKTDIPAEKIIHEYVHLNEQAKIGTDIWWQKYLSDSSFRLEEEVKAYRKEVQFIRKNIKDRNIAFKFVHQMSIDLSSSQYGKLVTQQEAWKLIR